MQQSLTVGAKRIDYVLNISARARSIRLSVYCGGKFVVTVPRQYSQPLVDAFIMEKASWVLRKMDELKRCTSYQLEQKIPGGLAQHGARALARAQAKVLYFNQFYGFSYNRIAVKDQKSRWGSCSVQRNLNFNYRLLFLPEGLFDYVVVHELCHLVFFNHSPAFWHLVEKTIPDYDERRRRLNHGALGAGE